MREPEPERPPGSAAGQESEGRPNETPPPEPAESEPAEPVVDYLYLSFTNATAFSPTDVMPLSRWAKLTMLVQSTVSLAIGALVIARAVNILRT
jgi:uncharacterized membrane protein